MGVPEKVECEPCHGRGFTKTYNENTGTWDRREHEACNGAGILLLRGIGNGGEPVYTAPKLS